VIRACWRWQPVSGVMRLNVGSPEIEKTRRCGLEVKVARWQLVGGRIGLSEIPARLPVSDVLLRNFRHVTNNNDVL